MIVAQHRYKQIGGYVVMDSKNQYQDGNGYEQRGLYNNPFGIVQIYVDSRRYSHGTDDKARYVTQLHFNHGGFSYSRYYNSTYSEKGLCRIASRLIKDAMKGRIKKGRG